MEIKSLSGSLTLENHDKNLHLYIYFQKMETKSQSVYFPLENEDKISIFIQKVKKKSLQKRQVNSQSVSLFRKRRQNLTTNSALLRESMLIIIMVDPDLIALIYTYTVLVVFLFLCKTLSQHIHLLRSFSQPTCKRSVIFIWCIMLFHCDRLEPVYWIE